MTERSIIMEALERTSALDQAAYLDRVCAGNRVLRARLEALLKSHDSAGQFLGKLAPRLLADELAAIPTADLHLGVEYGGTVVTLTNFTGSETEFGRYTLTALSSQISAGGQPLDGDANGAPGGDFVFGDAQGLFRFFGDINGDRHVEILDFRLLSLSIFNANNYNAAFDFNGDGVVDIADFGQFAIRIFTVLP